MKATFSGFDRCLFPKGTLVGVREYESFGRRVYGVVSVYKENPHNSSTMTVIEPKKSRPVNVTCTINTEKPMSMSKDRVKFTLGTQYLGMCPPNNTKAYKALELLEKAFGIKECEAKELIRKSHRLNEGITITCRPSQFARFMIYRDSLGIPNGFRDLKAELFVPEPKCDVYDRLAKIADTDRCTAKKIALALCYNGQDEIEDILGSRHRCDRPEIDVSKNPRCG